MYFLNEKEMAQYKLRCNKKVGRKKWSKYSFFILLLKNTLKLLKNIQLLKILDRIIKVCCL
jgi:hypothetical protein